MIISRFLFFFPSSSSWFSRLVRKEQEWKIESFLSWQEETTGLATRNWLSEVGALKWANSTRTAIACVRKAVRALRDLPTRVFVTLMAGRQSLTHSLAGSKHQSKYPGPARSFSFASILHKFAARLLFSRKLARSWQKKEEEHWQPFYFMYKQKCRCSWAVEILKYMLIRFTYSVNPRSTHETLSLSQATKF